MREDFLIDIEHFYLNNPPTHNVHPAGMAPAQAAYLNALHDVHQMYGHFSDDKGNDYYLDTDVDDPLGHPIPEIFHGCLLGPTVSQSSLDTASSLSFAAATTVVDDAVVVPSTGCSTGLRVVSVGDTPMVYSKVHSGGVLNSQPDPKEVDIVMVSSSDDES
ncbi:hypothetical protein MKX03_029303 [Papaver bracteatum]|nr:hypothetical protein MKX03_029303 [Papaver bracteatum]